MRTERKTGEEEEEIKSEMDSKNIPYSAHRIPAHNRIVVVVVVIASDGGDYCDDDEDALIKRNAFYAKLWRRSVECASIRSGGAFDLARFDGRWAQSRTMYVWYMYIYA